MSNNVKKDVEDKKQELKDYLFNLPPVNQLFEKVIIGQPAIRPPEEVIIDQEERSFREIIWELILSDDILTLCSFSLNDGLKLKLINRSRKIKDDKLFIRSIFATLHHYIFEYNPPIYKYSVIKKMHNLSNLYDELETIENDLSKTSTYKTSKIKRNIHREDGRKKLRINFKARIKNVIKQVINKDFDKIFWTQLKKRNEKVMIYLLYDCFKRANNSIPQQDVFYCIAKVILLFGTYKRSETVRNDELVTPQMFLKESARVEGIYRSFKKKISSC